MKQRVRIIKDLPEVKLVGRQLGPLTEGEEVELEGREVAILERHGFAEPFKKLTLTELRKLILAEERESKLVPLEADFYSSVVRRISSLRAAGDHETAGEIKAQVAALVEIRVSKLVQLALSPESAEDLPPEERFLINRLAATLDGWSRQLSESLEKIGEEVEKNEFGGPVRHVVGDEADIQKPRVPAPELHTGRAATSG